MGLAGHGRRRRDRAVAERARWISRRRGCLADWAPVPLRSLDGFRAAEGSENGGIALLVAFCGAKRCLLPRPAPNELTWRRAGHGRWAKGRAKRGS